MAPNYDCSGGSNDGKQSLGFLLCLLVIAYIYYFHTMFQQHFSPSQDQIQDLIEGPTVTAPATPTPNASSNNAARTPYDKGYYDGMKAYLHFDIADIKRAKDAVEKGDHSSREREKQMEKKLEDFKRECKQMESAMKTWREEYLRALWEVKQKGERGLLTGWLGFGSPRASKTMMKEEVRDDVVKLGSGRAEGKDEIRYDDLKKG